MTTPSSTIAASNINNEIGSSTTTTMSLNDTAIRSLARPGFYTSGSQISYFDLRNKAKYIPGSVLLTTPGSGSYTLPLSCSDTIYIRAVAGGGGGGGGNNRGGYWYTGGAGGGSGGIAYTAVTVIPGSTLTIVVGGGGTAGSVGDGPYTAAGVGGTGGATTVSYNGSQVIAASGGVGGGRSTAFTSTTYTYQYNVAGGAAGGVITGSSGGTATAGGNSNNVWSVNVAYDKSGMPSYSYYQADRGGAGARGFNPQTSTYGIVGTGGIGDCNIYISNVSTAGWPNGGYSPYWDGVFNRAAVSGSSYGAGGSGGGGNNSTSNVGSTATAGSSGAVYIWW